MYTRSHALGTLDDRINSSSRLDFIISLPTKRKIAIFCLLLENFAFKDLQLTKTRGIYDTKSITGSSAEWFVYSHFNWHNDEFQHWLLMTERDHNYLRVACNYDAIHHSMMAKIIEAYASTVYAVMLKLDVFWKTLLSLKMPCQHLCCPSMVWTKVINYQT